MKCFLFLFFTLTSKIRGDDNMRDMWRDAGRMTGLMLQTCAPYNTDQVQDERFVVIFLNCIKRRSLRALDRTLDDDVIALTSNIALIRNNNTAKARGLGPGSLPIAVNNQLKQIPTDWKTQVLRRLSHVFRTHVLKIRLNVDNEPQQASISEQGRGHRRRQSMMMTLVMFGMVAVGMVVIPMGFQFLAVLGGKALLLAKMALLLTSIQGLKKIATSHLNYGLYTTGGGGGGGGGGDAGSPCKNTFCNKQYNDGYHFDDDDDALLIGDEKTDDSISFAIDVDTGPFWRDYAGFWHYDRQWPFEAPEGLDANRPYNYYDPGKQQEDLYHPRNDVYNKMMN